MFIENNFNMLYNKIEYKGVEILEKKKVKEEKTKAKKARNKKPKSKSTKKKNNKKNIYIIIFVILGIIVLGIILYFIFDSINYENVKITKNETSIIEYGDYDNGLISLKIPKGWKVMIAPVDYIHYVFKVYNPNDSNYMFLFNLKQEGFLKSEKARSTYQKYYPDSSFAKLAAVEPQTTEAFYTVWNKNAKYINEVDINYEYLPYFNEFKVIDNLGKSIFGGDILRATYTDSNGKIIQGIFTANVKNVGTYYINTDIMNIFSERVDVSPLNVYNIIVMSAPDSEFNNWEPILNYCLSTLMFSDSFIKGFNSEEVTLMNSIRANQRIYDQISEGIMDSWEKRNDSYDIISQKQSDATLGYERVYDTETGDIYKAKNGFMDNYDGERYKTITDDMYTKATSGYIE